MDLTQNTNLESFLALYNPLSFLDMRNGNNDNVGAFNVFGTDDLQCIFVDDASAPYLENWYKDPFTTFVNNEAECDALGIESYTKDNWTMYPNPVTNFIFISSRESSHYVLTSANGVQLKTGVIDLGLSKVSVANLANGVYFLTLYTKDGSSTKKILKQ